MKRGCLIGVAFVIVLVAAYYVALRQTFEWPGDAIAAVLGGVFAAMFVSSIVGVGQAWRDTRRIRMAEEHKPPRDGEIVAVVGTIRPIDAPLQSPFGGKPCVAYEYEVSHVVQHASTRLTPGDSVDVREITGLALTPSIIDTAYGGVRLLSFALLDAFPQSRYADPASRQRAATYVTGTTFKPMGRGVSNVFTALDSLQQALTDDDGAVRMDWRMTGPDIDPEADLVSVVRHHPLAERIVNVGETVCAIGRYSSARRGLLSDGASSIVRLTPGDAKTARASVIKKALTTLAMASAFFVLSHAMLAAAVFMSETRYRRESTTTQFSVIQTAMQSEDVAQLNRVIRRGADPNVRDSFGRTPLHVTLKPMMARALITAGADVNALDNYGYTSLMLSASMGDPEMVQALLDSHAAVNLARRDGSTALSDALACDRATAPAAAALLVAAGAKSDLVTADTTASKPLPPDGGEPFEVVRGYIAAIHAHDIPALFAASIKRPANYFDDIDFALWHRIFPETPVYVDGFATPRAATLSVGGVTISNARRIWHFQLVFNGELWKIARDWDTAQSKPPAEPLERR
jgi:hypothetical protein